MILRTKYELYCQLIKDQQDQHGFIDHKHCDSTLFSGLVSCSPYVTVDLWAAYDHRLKEWHRRPVERPCHDPLDPKSSTISRDMLLGVLWSAWANRDTDMVQTVIDKALSNWGIMGRAGSLKVLWTKCQIMPPLFVTAVLLRNKLVGGRWYDKLLAKLVRASYGPERVGYQAHLQVLHILLRKLVAGISDAERDILERQAIRQPCNAVFNIAAGRVIRADANLHTSQWFPNGRLPASADRAESWLWQRDKVYADGGLNPDWLPSFGWPGQHHGGDFIFAYWLLNRLGQL